MLRGDAISLMSVNRKVDTFFSLLLKAIKMEKEKIEGKRKAPTDTFERRRNVILVFFSQRPPQTLLTRGATSAMEVERSPRRPLCHASHPPPNASSRRTKIRGHTIKETRSSSIHDFLSAASR